MCFYKRCMEYKVAKETERLEELQREVVDTDNELFASKLAYRQVQRENEDELREIKQEISEKQSENLKLDYAISYKRDKLEEYEDEMAITHIGQANREKELKADGTISSERHAD